MAGPLQAGDIINLAKIAWQVYEFGWAEEHNATKQYKEFGQDVRGLAESLDILDRVVLQATNSLRHQGLNNALVRWDRVSFAEIIGDYEGTLNECKKLLRDNARYRGGSGPGRNIEWNVMVQPTVERLRQRIALHNSKILHVMKPFEIDLLCRVRQDIYRVHHDLAQRITAVHSDLNRLMGVLIPNLDQALNQQAMREVHLLDIPIDVAERFRMAALTDRPEYNSDDAFELSLLSDAFVLNYKRSTVNFRGGRLISDRIPPVDQYLNLLKCVWLYKRMMISPNLEEAHPESHWPSFIKQLEDDVSSECARFNSDLVKPDLPLTPVLRGDMFTIWPEREPNQLVDVVTRDEMMEQILESPLQSVNSSVERSVKLLRRMGADGRRFRIIISGSEQSTTGRPRQQSEVIDFDIGTVVINPQYALPTTAGLMKEILIHRDERIARLSFVTMEQVLKFQQAVTGYKPWVAYSQYNAMVSFVIGNAKPIVEDACIQLWIPKPVDGSIVTNTDASAEAVPISPSRSATTWTGMSTSPTSPRATMPSPFATPVNRRGSQAQPVPQQPRRSSTIFSTSWPRRSSPTPLGTSPPGALGYLSPTPSRSSRPVQLPFPSMHNFTGPSSLGTSSMPHHGSRSHSVSSIVSTAPTSTSSGSDGQTKTISTGTYTTGLLLRKPIKPMLVLYTQDQQGGNPAIVTVDIDEDTAVNPERCNCRRSARGGGDCAIAALERFKGKADLAARRYEYKDGDWNIAQLALNYPSSPSSENTASWPGLKRLSLFFSQVQERERFGGSPGMCHCRNRTEGELSECLRAKHRGLLGEVAEHWRRQLQEYHRHQNEREPIVMQR
ncbi:hypothetical protein B0I35DRAFT_349664 [Stachybotrys elegans]|uniref:Uncharacterized protein n=1 Tax=Stachybotrys elegans TaxID=80388 RepID=A0A8K0SXM1_9HYPO|nr:hypothetical protein B0I35DRAFT_349664 [Stachybotrys elegans]